MNRTAPQKAIPSAGKAPRRIHDANRSEVLAAAQEDPYLMHGKISRMDSETRHQLNGLLAEKLRHVWDGLAAKERVDVIPPARWLDFLETDLNEGKTVHARIASDSLTGWKTEDIARLCEMLGVYKEKFFLRADTAVTSVLANRLNGVKTLLPRLHPMRWLNILNAKMNRDENVRIHLREADIEAWDREDYVQLYDIMTAHPGKFTLRADNMIRDAVTQTLKDIKKIRAQYGPVPPHRMDDPAVDPAIVKRMTPEEYKQWNDPLEEKKELIDAIPAHDGDTESIGRQRHSKSARPSDTKLLHSTLEESHAHARRPQEDGEQNEESIFYQPSVAKDDTQTPRNAPRDTEIHLPPRDAGPHALPAAAIKEKTIFRRVGKTLSGFWRWMRGTKGKAA